MRLPASKNFELPKRYPWLLRGRTSDNAASWEVSFNDAGIPLKIEPADEAVAVPVLTYVKRRSGDYRNFTRGICAGSGDNARLSESGERVMRLLIWPD